MRLSIRTQLVIVLGCMALLAFTYLYVNRVNTPALPLPEVAPQSAAQPGTKFVLEPEPEPVYFELKGRATKGGNYTVNLDDPKGRFFAMHVPPSYKDNKPVPVFVFAHRDNIVNWEELGSKITELNVQSDKDGFILVLVVAQSRSEAFGNPHYIWNSPDGSLRPFDAKLGNDLEYFRAVHRRVSKIVSADPKKIFIGGLGGGALMQGEFARMGFDDVQIAGFFSAGGTELDNQPARDPGQNAPREVHIQLNVDPAMLPPDVDGKVVKGTFYLEGKARGFDGLDHQRPLLQIEFWRRIFLGLGGSEEKKTYKDPEGIWECVVHIFRYPDGTERKLSVWKVLKGDDGGPSGFAWHGAQFGGDEPIGIFSTKKFPWNRIISAVMRNKPVPGIVEANVVR